MKYFHNFFDGRINRLTYLFGLVLLTFLVIEGGIYIGKKLAYPNIILFLGVIILYYILCGTYYYSLMVRRRHDTNKQPENGIPTVNNLPVPGDPIPYYLIWLFLLEGDAKDNEYGPPPLKGIDFYALFLGNKKEMLDKRVKLTGQNTEEVKSTN